jgi:ferredoxin-NADP reductase
LIWACGYSKEKWQKYQVFVYKHIYCCYNKSMAKSFQLPFIKKVQVAKNTFSFYFDRREVDFYFLPGQYIHMQLPHTKPDYRGTTRFFTIASSPLEKEHLMITTKVIKSTFKKTLASLKPGSVVNFFGPSGRVVLDETDLTPKVFLAGNIGITPFRSMLHFAAAKKLAISLTLLVSFKRDEEKVFYDELQLLRNEKRKIIYETGSLSEAMIKKYIPDMQKPIFYIIGPPKIVAATKKILKKLSLPEERIITEEFIDY